MKRVHSAWLVTVLTTLAFTGTALGATPIRPATVLSTTLGIRDLGRAPAAMPVQVALSLAYRHDAELEQLIALQGDPSSSLFRHYLSNEQFNTYFAPTEADYARTIATLQRAGFSIEKTYANRTLIDAVAPAAVAERFFGTEIHRVAQGSDVSRYANVRAASIRDGLRGVIDDVAGLENLVWSRPGFEPVAPFGALGVDVIGQPLRGGDGGLGPLATAQGYDLPVQHGFDGKGRVTGNVICGDHQNSDLNGFLKYFKIKRTGPATVRVKVDGGGKYGGLGDGCSVEATLDAETIVGNAPGTAFYEYTMPDLSNKHLFDTYNQVVSDNLVDVVNSSFGGCELKTQPKTTNKFAKQGAAKGITFNASTGDMGSMAFGCSGTNVQAPAVDPYFVAVGGTTLSVDTKGNYISETGWSGSGGGISVIFPIPSYQKATLPKQTMRNIPDLSSSAGCTASSYVSIYMAGGWGFGGGCGTSWSSPTYSALQTEVDEIDKTRDGQANTTIYKLFGSQQYKLFRDITTGSNGAYTAGKGYDNVTGIGSVRGYRFAKAE